MIHGKEKTVQNIDEALAAGYRLFDSAHLYRNERDLGNAFKELLPKHNLSRSDIFITTKFGKFNDFVFVIFTDVISISVPSSRTQAEYENLINESLTNLQTDYIDLYLIHWPGSYAQFQGHLTKLICMSLQLIWKNDTRHGEL